MTIVSLRIHYCGNRATGQLVFAMRQLSSVLHQHRDRCLVEYSSNDYRPICRVDRKATVIADIGDLEGQLWGPQPHYYNHKFKNVEPPAKCSMSSRDHSQDVFPDESLTRMGRLSYPISKRSQDIADTQTLRRIRVLICFTCNKNILPLETSKGHDYIKRRKEFGNIGWKHRRPCSGIRMWLRLW